MSYRQRQQMDQLRNLWNTSKPLVIAAVVILFVLSCCLCCGMFSMLGALTDGTSSTNSIVATDPASTLDVFGTQTGAAPNVQAATELPTDVPDVPATLIPTTAAPVSTVAAIPTNIPVSTSTSMPTSVPASTLPPTNTAVPTPTTIPPTTAPPVAACDCSGDIYNCSSFPLPGGVTANQCHAYCISQGRGDIHNLDGNADGDPCEAG